jgi:hypothetical protein
LRTSVAPATFMQKIGPPGVLLLRGIEQVVVGRAVWTIEVTVDLAAAVEGIAGPVDAL